MNLNNQQLIIRNHGEMPSRVDWNRDNVIQKILKKSSVLKVLLNKMVVNNIYMIIVIILCRK